jgi:hypothetical protein
MCTLSASSCISLVKPPQASICFWPSCGCWTSTALLAADEATAAVPAKAHAARAASATTVRPDDRRGASSSEKVPSVVADRRGEAEEEKEEEEETGRGGRSGSCWVEVSFSVLFPGGARVKTCEASFLSKVQVPRTAGEAPLDHTAVECAHKVPFLEETKIDLGQARPRSDLGRA